MFMHRADVVPRISYAAVEGVLKDLIAASPVQRAATAANKLGQRVQQTLAGLKVNLDTAMRKPKWGSFGGQEGEPCRLAIEHRSSVAAEVNHMGFKELLCCALQIRASLQQGPVCRWEFHAKTFEHVPWLPGLHACVALFMPPSCMPQRHVLGHR